MYIQNNISNVSKITYKTKGHLISYIPLLIHVPKRVYQLRLNPMSNDSVKLCIDKLYHTYKSNIYLNCNKPKTHNV